MTAENTTTSTAWGEVVVDTDVVSYLYKRDSRSQYYRPHLDGRIAIISAQTIAELYHWPERANWGTLRRAQFERFLDAYEVFYPDQETCRIYGKLTADAHRAGHVVPAADVWHAATALRLELPLITNNARNYQGIPRLVLITEQHG